MSPRREVTDALQRLAFVAELLGDRRARAWGGAAWAIRSAEGDLAELLESGELAKLRGVGEVVLEVVSEILAGRRPARLAEMEAQIPEGLFAIRRIQGLGPKKVKALHDGLGVSSLAELEYACRENRLVALPGFGKKTQDKVLEQIAGIRATEGLSRRDRAEAALEPVMDAARAAGATRVEPVHDLPRGEELIRELGVLLAPPRDEPDRGRCLAAASGARPEGVVVAIHVSDEEGFGARRVWLTSEPGYRDRLAVRAEDRGLRFDDGGLLDPTTGERAPCPEEDDLYAALGLSPQPAERRREAVPLVQLGRALTPLVTARDLRGALHNHTTASDGSATLTQMRDAAAAWGLSYLGISEHSQAAAYAGGLDAERLLAQLDEIARLNADPGGCVLLTGVESDILADGSLDYPPEVLARLDVVVASVHQRHQQGVEAMSRRMLAAARDPHTSVVGHPTGRLLLGRAPSEFDVAGFLDACAASGVAVELNANPARLDLSAEHLRMAKERGVLVSISADAHSTPELDNLHHGVAVARAAGLTAEDVLNSRGLDELRAWLAA